jgi:3-isopropylmalate dehydrogenase
MLKKKTIAVLAGDGIGVEVTREALQVLRRVLEIRRIPVEFVEYLIGGASIDKFGRPLTRENLARINKCHAVLLGAVGGKKWEGLPYERRPERALLALRKALGAFANLRPAKVFAALADASTIKRDVLDGVDIMVVRELTGGIYFGKPRGIARRGGTTVGFNTELYSIAEIRRIARAAFDIAGKRRGKVTSVDKANVLESSELWRKTVVEVHRAYPGIELSHMYVDNCAMQLVRNPRQFDVIVTTNMFGDILSDEAAMVTGSIGMLPSASLAWGGRNSKGIYEPIHGSAPDIAGKGIANPLAAILSAGMMLKFSFGDEAAAGAVERAVESALDDGLRTADIAKTGEKVVNTAGMGEAVLERFKI